MKVVGIVGSPRINGNTEILTAHTLKAVSEEGIETELIRLAKLDIRPCIACDICKSEERCSIEDDLFPVYLKMKQADGIILASPVYYGSATGLIKAFMERTGFIGRWNGDVFSGKCGGPLVVARRAGQNFTLAQLTFWFQSMGMVIVSSKYWTMAIGREKGEVNNDTEGMETAWVFGKNLAGVLKKLKGG